MVKRKTMVASKFKEHKDSSLEESSSVMDSYSVRMYDDKNFSSNSTPQESDQD